MAAKYIAGTMIKTIQVGSRQLVLEYVSETTAWKRVHIGQSVLDDFCTVVERNVDSLRPDTVYVALKCVEKPKPTLLKTMLILLRTGRGTI